MSDSSSVSLPPSAAGRRQARARACRSRNGGVTAAGRVARGATAWSSASLDRSRSGTRAARSGSAGARQRELLAILLLHAGEVVSTDRLMDALWGEGRPAAGATALRVRVSQLRKALGPGGQTLVTRPPGYALLVERDGLDLRRFERELDEADRSLAAGDAAGALEHAQSALSLWRGPPLADFAYASFAQAAIARLEELRVAALELRIDAELALGRHRHHRRRAAGAHRGASAARAALAAAHARALPRRPPGGGARRVSLGAHAARRGDRDRAGAGAAGTGGADPGAGSGPRRGRAGRTAGACAPLGARAAGRGGARRWRAGRRRAARRACRPRAAGRRAGRRPRSGGATRARGSPRCASALARAASMLVWRPSPRPTAGADAVRLAAEQDAAAAAPRAPGATLRDRRHPG